MLFKDGGRQPACHGLHLNQPGSSPDVVFHIHKRFTAHLNMNFDLGSKEEFDFQLLADVCIKAQFHSWSS